MYLEAIVAGLESVRAVPGRMEAVDRGQPFHVIVDYAHTPGSLEAVAGLGRVAVQRGAQQLDLDLLAGVVALDAGGDDEQPVSADQ